MTLHQRDKGEDWNESKATEEIEDSSHTSEEEEEGEEEESSEDEQLKKNIANKNISDLEVNNHSKFYYKNCKGVYRKHLFFIPK